MHRTPEHALIGMEPDGPFTGRRANRRDNPVYIHLAGSPSSYTAGDHVNGAILLSQVRSTRISIALRGFTVVPHPSAKAVHIEFYRESQDLFVSSGTGEELDLLPKSSVIPGRTEVPFSFTFARHANLPPPTDRNWLHPEDSYNHPRFQHSPGFPLPPSCPTTAPTNVQTLYQLEVTLENSTPNGLPVRVRQELKYMPPPPNFRPGLLEPDLNFGTKLPKHCSREKLIRSRKLFRNYEERSSKLMKIKDKLADKELLFGSQSLAEVPYAKFSISATPASVLVIGSQVPVIISVKHLQRSASIVNPPDLFIRRVKVQLNSAYNIFIPGDPTGRQTKKPCLHTERGQHLLYDRKYERGNGEPLYDGLALLEIADVRLTDHDFVPSFTTYGLNLEYELQVEITGTCVDREWSGIVCTQPIHLVTALPASIPFELGDDDAAYDLDLRPMYHEVDPMEQPYDSDVSWESQERGATPLVYEVYSRHMVPPTMDTVPPPEYAP